MHQSCRTTKWYCIQLIKLLTPVCDINAENNEGARLIHLAAQYDNLEVVCHLVDCGCDVAAKDKQGRNNIKRDQALKQDGYTRLKVIKCILTGPPGAGKSTLKKRFLNESLGDDLSTGVVNAAVQVDSFHKLDQQDAIVPNINEDSTLEWKKNRM